MLKYRIPAGFAIVIAFYCSLQADAASGGSFWLTLFFAAGSVVVLREFYRMVEAKGAKPLFGFGMIMMVALVFANDRWCWEKWHGFPRSTPDLMSTVLAICVLGAIALQGVRPSPKGAILNVGATWMGLIYIWFLPAFLVKIRHLGFVRGAALPEGWESFSIPQWRWDGVELVFATVLVAKSSDIWAFFVGKRFGKHKLSPVVSPNKTWEGAAGGVIGSVVFACALRYFAPTGALGQLPWMTVVLFGMLMAVTSLLGDLFESTLKRDSEMKDSGGSVPGFGGLLDVIDSLMISAPVAYFFFLLVGARPAV